MASRAKDDQRASPQRTVEVSVKGKWFTVPALEVDGKNIIVRGKWLRTALIHEEEWLDTGVGNPELCVQQLKAATLSELRADLFTFTQKAPSTSPKHAYHVEYDSVAVAHVPTFQEWWEKLPQETRKNVRRAKKRGVVVVVKPLDERLIEDIRTLNNDSMVRQGKAFSHYGKSIEEVEKDQEAFLDRSDYICAYVGDELIGLLKLVYRGDVASILTFVPKASQHDKRPANALVAKAVELCEAKGVSYLIYGMFNYGNKQHTSLREFKIRNGFEEMMVPRYYVPLTWKGRAMLKLKCHRGLTGLLPHGVITALLKVRAGVYALVFSRCSLTTERPNCNRQMERSIPPAGSSLTL